MSLIAYYFFAQAIGANTSLEQITIVLFSLWEIWSPLDNEIELRRRRKVWRV